MTQMTIDDLFTPTPSGIGPQGAAAAPTPGSWMDQNLQNAVAVGLDTTAWQPGTPTRSWLAVSAVDQAKEDTIISTMAQAGFLDFCAGGTVSYTDPTGVTTTAAVSPDPSDPSSGNTTGAPTWLDLLASSKYNVIRTPQTPASGDLTFANTSASSPSAYPAGTYHAQSASTPTSTYQNKAALTIPISSVLGGHITAIGSSGTISVTTSSAHGLTTGARVYIAGAPSLSNANGFWQVTVTGSNTFLLNGSTANLGGSVGTVYSTFAAPFVADTPGPASSTVPGDITQTVTANSGVFVTNFAAFTGSPYESNASVANRCRLKLASLSPNGASGAYEFFGLTAYQILLGTAPGFPAPATPIQLECGPISRAITRTSFLTGTVNLYVAPSNPQATSQGAATVAGATNVPIVDATNASPIEVSTPIGHGLTTGDFATISGVLGNTNANGVWQVTVIDPNIFTLDGSAGNATYTGGGQVESGDLGSIDTVIQTWCVPDGDTALTHAATAQLFAIAATVTVPSAQKAAYLANVNALLTSYVNALPIGGLPLAGGGTGLPIDVVIGLLFQAGSVAGAKSYVQNLSGVTINGVAADCAYTVPLVGVLYPAPALTVNGS